MELQACVGPPDMDCVLLFHRLGVTILRAPNSFGVK
jgi:hypothetical protein